MKIIFEFFYTLNFYMYIDNAQARYKEKILVFHATFENRPF